MRSKPLIIFGSILLVITTQTRGQEWSLEEVPAALRERAVVVDIVARVLEQDRREVWNSVASKLTIPGRPVGIKLVGANIVVAVQFTPYRRGDGSPMLVAQGQIWIDIPNEGMSYQTTIETIVLDYGEPIFFFPLGSAAASNKAHIEIQVVLQPYLNRARATEETASARQAQDAPNRAAADATSTAADAASNRMRPEQRSIPANESN